MQCTRIQSNFELAFTFFCPRQRRLQRLALSCIGVVADGNTQLHFTSCTRMMRKVNTISRIHEFSEVKTTWTLRCSYARDVRCCHSSSLNVRPKVKLVFAHCSRCHRHATTTTDAVVVVDNFSVRCAYHLISRWQWQHFRIVSTPDTRDLGKDFCYFRFSFIAQTTSSTTTTTLITLVSWWNNIIFSVRREIDAHNKHKRPFSHNRI